MYFDRTTGPFSYEFRLVLVLVGYMTSQMKGILVFIYEGCEVKTVVQFVVDVGKPRSKTVSSKDVKCRR